MKASEEEDVDDDEDDGDAIATSAFVDDYENGESDVETSDSDDADERDDGIGGIAESDEDEDEDDLDEDEDEEKYAMLVVLANMDGNNDDIAEMNVKLERHGEHKIDREIFSGFRGVEAQLKRENIQRSCLRLTSSYSASRWQYQRCARIRRVVSRYIRRVRRSCGHRNVSNWNCSVVLALE